MEEGNRVVEGEVSDVGDPDWGLLENGKYVSLYY